MDDQRPDPTPPDLDSVLRVIAGMEHDVRPSERDVLAYLEGCADEDASARVHHALAHSPSFRKEMLELLEEQRTFDPQAVEVAQRAMQTESVPSLTELESRVRPRAAASRRTPAPVRGLWRAGLGLAAAVALVLLLVPRERSGPEIGSVPQTVEILARARAFPPSVTRGDSPRNDLALAIPEGARSARVGLWVPESWQPRRSQSITVAVAATLRGGETIVLDPVPILELDGDPAVLVDLPVDRLRPGQLELRLSLPREGGIEPPEVIAHFVVERSS